jgi:hypothetical protein
MQKEYEVIYDKLIHLYGKKIACNLNIPGKLQYYKWGVGAPTLSRCPKCYTKEFLLAASYNINGGYWQQTNNRILRNNARSIQIGQMFEDVNKKDWIYLGKYNTYDSKKDWFSGYLLKNGDSYLFVKELRILNILKIPAIIINLDSIKKDVESKCKTFDDYLKAALVLNCSIEERYIHPYFIKK